MFKPVNAIGTTVQILTLRKHFTPNMGDHIGSIAEECLRATKKQYELFPTIVDLRSFVLDVVAAASSRVLLGEPLCSNVELMDELREFSGKVSQIMDLSAVLPRTLISRVAADVNRSKEEVAKHVIPEIRRRRAVMVNENGHDESKSVTLNGKQKPTMTFLDYLLQMKELNGELLGEKRLVEVVCVMVFAAYDTTTHAVTNLLYDISGRAEVKRDLIAEQRAVQSRFGSALTVKAINNMPLLELALRESQRLSVGALTPVRMVKKEGVRCSDGTMLPKGTIMALSPWLVHFDPNIHLSPYEFRLDRFANADGSGGYPPTRKFLNFGGGKHQCPGRFFATLEIKIIVSAIFAEFDLSATCVAPYDYSNGMCKRKAVPVTLKKKL